MQTPRNNPVAPRDLRDFEESVAALLGDEATPDRLDAIGALILKDPVYLRLLREQLDTNRLLQTLYNKGEGAARPRPVLKLLALAAAAALLLTGIAWAALRLTASSSPASQLASPAPSTAVPASRAEWASAPTPKPTPVTNILLAATVRTNVPAAAPAAVTPEPTKEQQATMSTIQTALVATVAVAVSAAPLGVSASRYPGYDSTPIFIDTRPGADAGTEFGGPVDARAGDDAYSDESTINTKTPTGTIYRFF